MLVLGDEPACALSFVWTRNTGMQVQEKKLTTKHRQCAKKYTM